MLCSWETFWVKIPLCTLPRWGFSWRSCQSSLAPEDSPSSVTLPLPTFDLINHHTQTRDICNCLRIFVSALSYQPYCTSIYLEIFHCCCTSFMTPTVRDSEKSGSLESPPSQYYVPWGPGNLSPRHSTLNWPINFVQPLHCASDLFSFMVFWFQKEWLGKD